MAAERGDDSVASPARGTRNASTDPQDAEHERDLDQPYARISDLDREMRRRATGEDARRIARELFPR